MKSLRESLLDDDLVDKLDKSIKDEIKAFLRHTYKGHSNCKISRLPNKDGKYEVYSTGDIQVIDTSIEYLTDGSFVWTEVAGKFDCYRCTELKSLEGAPRKVGGGFGCMGCTSLVNLKGMPEFVGGLADFTWCKSLESLEGIAREIIGGLTIESCDKITSLKPLKNSEILRYFICSGCSKLKSLEGAPKMISGTFVCNNCTSLKSLKYAPKETLDFRCRDCGVKFDQEYIRKEFNAHGLILC
jgi:hypothetical protein